MRLKVAGGIDQLHIPGREGSLAQGRDPHAPFKAQHSPPLPLKPSLATPAATSISSPPLPHSTWLDPDYPTDETKGGPSNQSPKVDQLVIKGPLSMANPKLFPAKL